MASSRENFVNLQYLYTSYEILCQNIINAFHNDEI